MSKENSIMCSGNRLCTKKDILKLIDEAFPDEEVGTHGTVAVITTITMEDGVVKQSVTFGKNFRA